MLQSQLDELDAVDLEINTLDEPGRGVGGMYLTVLGVSGEGADGGEVGRGNRVNGLISLNRPMSMEAAAGKNPVSHVGKIYNVLSHQIAAKVCQSQDAVREATLWLCSQIGRPLDQPWFASAHLVLAPGANLGDVEKPVQDIITAELAQIESFTDKLARGEFPVF